MGRKKINLKPDQMTFLRQLFARKVTKKEIEDEFHAKFGGDRISYRTLQRILNDNPEDANNNLVNIEDLNSATCLNSEFDFQDIYIHASANPVVRLPSNIMTILEEEQLSQEVEEVDIADNFDRSVMKRNVSANSITSLSQPRRKRRSCLTLEGQRRKNLNSRDKLIENETADQTESRLQRQRLRTEVNRDQETLEDREARLQRQLARTDANRDQETLVDREARLQRQLARTDANRDQETLEEREARLQRQLARTEAIRNQETEDQRLSRLLEQQERTAHNRDGESPTSRDLRLAEDAARHRLRRDGRPIEPYEEEQELRRLRINQSTKHGSLYNRGFILFDANPPRIITEHKLGKFDQVCQFCDAFYCAEERNQKKQFTTCCALGKIDLPKPRRVHPVLESLHCPDPDDPVAIEHAKDFKQKIMQYNSTLAFASVCATLDLQRGMFVYRIQGTIYRKTPPALVDDQYNAQTGQFYFMDSDLAHSERLRLSTVPYTLNDEVLRKLENMIAEVNPYLALYKCHKEKIDEQRRQIQVMGQGNITVRMFLQRPVFGHGIDAHIANSRHTNFATSGEVAAIFEEVDGNVPTGLSVCIYPRSDRMTMLNYLDPNTDPMCYPLLFPYGEKGFELNIPHGRQTRVRNRTTIREYYAFYLAKRRNCFNLLQRSGKLFQQFVVDAYVKVESDRINFLKRNQPILRIHQYQGLKDHIEKRANEEGRAVGRIFVLPSTFCGGDRYMRRNLQDSMVIVRNFGKPDLFITFTSNPGWKEIKAELKPGQTYLDDPVTCVRVFYRKLQAFLDQIFEKHIFGVPVGFVWVVEFQKRGLPHVHMVLMLSAADKITTTDKLDSLIWAQIPDQDLYPTLYGIVVGSMMHGPCLPDSPCMQKDGVNCSKHFPKEFCEQTIMDVNGSPRYKRPDNGRHVIVKNQVLDNRYVVPYSPYLSMMFNCHINVECCSSIHSVKYLFQYINKGNEYANVQINASRDDPTEQNLPALDHDESKFFLTGRYISAMESSYRLFEFPMNSKSHTIYRLPIHLEDRQSIIFREGEEEAMIALNEGKNTMLLAWFELNKRDPEARQYLYSDIPMHYVYDQKLHEWKERQRGNERVLSRIYTISPKNIELFHFRILLLHVPGAQSFEQLRTVDNQVFESYRAAAIARNIVDNDQQWVDTLTQAVATETPFRLRFLFAMICVHCSPSLPSAAELWELFKDSFYEDFIHAKDSDYVAENKALQHLDYLFKSNGTSCKDLGLPEPDMTVGDYRVYCNTARSAATATVDDHARFATELMSTVNTGQREVLDLIQRKLASTDQNESKCVFIDGPGGTGKTFVFKILQHIVKARGQTVYPVAFTGIAASLMDGGTTAHARFKLPVPLEKDSQSNLQFDSLEAKELREATLILWDEAPMVSMHMLDAVDRLFRELTGNHNTPFGGKVIVLAGDFRQTLPVVTTREPAAALSICLKKSRVWRFFEQTALTQNMRALSSEIEFADWLLRIGEGREPTIDNDSLVHLPDQCMLDNQQEIIDFVFGRGQIDPEVLSNQNRAILCPKNVDTLVINEIVLERLLGIKFTYFSADHVLRESEDGEEFPMEMANSMTPNGMPPHSLNLKVGAVVILLKNMCTSEGLCNGTRMRVDRMNQLTVTATILYGPHGGKQFTIPRVVFPADEKLPIKIRRIQIPFRLAFAMTIVKSQGQTFDKIGLCLREPVFSHGQLYVAMSRVRSFGSVKIWVQDIAGGSNRQGCILHHEGTYTKNVVLRQALV